MNSRNVYGRITSKWLHRIWFIDFVFVILRTSFRVKQNWKKNIERKLNREQKLVLTCIFYKRRLKEGFIYIMSYQSHHY